MTMIAPPEWLALLQALARQTAEGQGLLLATIKGETFAHHGIRLERTSADVDVLLHPDDSNAFIDTMGEIGWRPRTTTSTQPARGACVQPSAGMERAGAGSAW